MAGYYSLQDYAVQFWFHHLRECIKPPVISSPEMLREVIEGAQKFFEAYGLQSKLPAYQYASDYVGINRVLNELPEDENERNAYLTIEFRTTLIRNAIENINQSTLYPADKQVLANLYGEIATYKCPKSWCNHFISGFRNADDRRQHINRHDLPFRCPLENCFAFELGFDNGAKLGQHKKEHHPDPGDDKIVFPKKTTRSPNISKAIKEGDLATIKALLDSGTRKKGFKLAETGIESAAKHGRTEICKLLLERGGSVSFSAASDRALIIAAISGHFDVCKLLLDSGANANHRDLMGRTALHRAAVAGHLHVVDLLVNQSASDPDIPDTHGITPFCDACAYGHLEIVKLLVSTGKVQVDRCLESTVQHNPYGTTLSSKPMSPLSYACMQGHITVVQYLLQNGQSRAVGGVFFAEVLNWGHEIIIDLLRPIAANNFLASTHDLTSTPVAFKESLQDGWSIIFNPAISRTLQVEMVKSIPWIATNCIRISPTGDYMAVGCIGTVELYDLTYDGYHYDELSMDDGLVVLSVCFSPDGKYIIGGGYGKLINVSFRACGGQY